MHVVLHQLDDSSGEEDEAYKRKDQVEYLSPYTACISDKFEGLFARKWIVV